LSHSGNNENASKLRRFSASEKGDFLASGIEYDEKLKNTGKTQGIGTNKGVRKGTS